MTEGSALDVLARFRKHPLLRLDEERIRTRAYFLSEARTSRDAVENWLEAEEDETRLARRNFVTASGSNALATPAPVFEENYDSVFSWWSDPVAPTKLTPRLGTKTPRRCSICLRDQTTATFKTDAHVLPEQLGTPALITWDECDQCNLRAGQDYESDLGKMLLPDRALMGTRSKTGTAKLQNNDKGAFVGGQRRGARVVIGLKDDDPTVTSRKTGANTFTLEVSSPAFRPRRVVKALAKMAWQALPNDLRPHADAIRAYVNEEVDWPTAQFYRASVPGSTRIALGLWRRTATADATLPEFVTLVSTANTVLVWTSPDLVTGQYHPALLPPFPQVPGTTIRCTKVSAEGDGAVAAGRSKYELEFQAIALAYAQAPMRVRVTIVARSGDTKSFEGTLGTPRGLDGASENTVEYEIKSEEFIGILRLTHDLVTGRFLVDYSFDVAATRDVDPNTTKGIVEALLSGGAEVGVAWLDEDRPGISMTNGRALDFDLSHFEDGVALALQLAVVRDEFGINIAFPKELNEGDRRVLKILAEGAKNGVVHETGHGEEELSLTREQALGLIEALDHGKQIEPWGRNTLPWTLFGTTVDAGEARIFFEGVSIDEPLLDLKARTLKLSAEEPVIVKLRFKSVRHEFLRFANPVT